jgi:hypothetical protein
VSRGLAAVANFTYAGALNFNNSAAQNSGNTGDLNSTFFGSAGGSISNYVGVGTFAAAEGRYRQDRRGFFVFRGIGPDGYRPAKISKNFGQPVAVKRRA